MAALEAIVRLQPSEPFAGSSYVLPALGFFAGSSGSRHALVAAPQLRGRARPGGNARRGRLRQTDTFTNGKELVLQAAQSPDYELALIDVTIDRPVIGILLQQLRHDPRTASLRVGLIARAGYLRSGRTSCRARSAGQGVLAAARRCQAFRWQLRSIGHARAAAVRRLPGAPAASGRGPRSAGRFAPVVEQALRPAERAEVRDRGGATIRSSPPRRSACWPTINSAESQQALVDVASRLTSPLRLRQAAARAFRQNTAEVRHPVDDRGNPPTIPALQREREAGRRHATRAGVDPRLPGSRRAEEEMRRDGRWEMEERN